MGVLLRQLCIRRCVMCTLAIYVRQLPGLPLVVAANRDEFLDRAATGPELLASAPRIVGGRDLLAGGTWLAISERGARRRAAESPHRRAAGREQALARRAAAARRSRPDSAAAAARDDRGARPATPTTRSTCWSPIAASAWVAQNHDDAMRVTALEPRAAPRRATSTSTIPTCPKIARSHARFAAAGDAFARDARRPTLPRRAARDRRRPHARRSTRACPTRSARSASTPAVRDALLVAALPRRRRPLAALVRRRPAVPHAYEPALVP